MKILFNLLLLVSCFLYACDDSEIPETPGAQEILGFDLLTDITGHWVGSNQTAFGLFDWFAFDFRPISGSHSHSIYEGATNQNIINSVFVADVDGEQRIVARNGGWLGSQYRATYFVLDIASKNGDESFYRLVDAIGRENRAFVEFRFKQDSMFFDAYKDNSGRLDLPELHMSFKGANRNSEYASNAIELFDFPSTVSEVNLTDAFDNLVDPDSALFLEEADDPFPKSDHGYVSDLTIDIIRDADTENQGLFLFISKEVLVSSDGIANVDNIDNSVIRTIQIRNAESNYVATYLHPDDYYLTVFMDNDNNGFPSTGDRSSESVFKQVRAESVEEASVELSLMVE